MSFREKSAWVTLCAILIVSLMYWLHMPSLFGPAPAISVVHAIGASLAAYILIEVVAWFLFRLRNPEEASEPKDEREKLIDLKAIRIAHHVFVLATLSGIFVVLHVADTGRAAAGMVVLMSLVLAETVKHAARIVFYRRGF